MNLERMTEMAQDPEVNGKSAFDMGDRDTRICFVESPCPSVRFCC